MSRRCKKSLKLKSDDRSQAQKLEFSIESESTENLVIRIAINNLSFIYSIIFRSYTWHLFKILNITCKINLAIKNIGKGNFKIKHYSRILFLSLIFFLEKSVENQTEYLRKIYNLKNSDENESIPSRKRNRI